MKKIIVFICLCLCVCFGFKDVDAVSEFDVTITGTVDGNINKNITKSVTFTISNELVTFNEDLVGCDVTSWFNNIPEDCDYTATCKFASDEICMVEFTGKIGKDAIVGTTPIDATIDVVSDDEEEDVCPLILYNGDNYIDTKDAINDNANYVITDNFVIQYDGPYTVSGYVGEELIPQVVRVEITTDTDTFNSEEILNQVLSTPNGMYATVSESIDNKHITITYTGTPVEESQDLIETTISKDYMDFKRVDRAVPNREDVKFNITKKVIPPVIEDDDPIPYIPPVTGID